MYSRGLLAQLWGGGKPRARWENASGDRSVAQIDRLHVVTETQSSDGPIQSRTTQGMANREAGDHHGVESGKASNARRRCRRWCWQTLR